MRKGAGKKRRDNTLRLFDVLSRAALSVLTWLPGLLATLTFLFSSAAALALPFTRSFLTGGEDGYVRLHHFDLDYFTTKFF